MDVPNIFFSADNCSCLRISNKGTEKMLPSPRWSLNSCSHGGNILKIHHLWSYCWKTTRKFSVRNCGVVSIRRRAWGSRSTSSQGINLHHGCRKCWSQGRVPASLCSTVGKLSWEGSLCMNNFTWQKSFFNISFPLHWVMKCLWIQLELSVWLWIMSELWHSSINGES